jgi:hypothetical protein
LTTGTKHTLTFSITLGSDNHNVKVDSGTPLNVPSQSFNNTKTTHGIVLKYDAGGSVSGGPVDNFQIQ